MVGWKYCGPEIRKEFCREIKAISLKYSEPQRVPSRYNNNYIHRRNIGWSVGSTAVITMLVLGCCACCCIVAFFKKAKEMFNNKRGNSNAWEAASTNSNLNVDAGNMPYPIPGMPAIPPTQPGYPPGPVYPPAAPNM